MEYGDIPEGVLSMASIYLSSRTVMTQYIIYRNLQHAGL